MWIGRPRLLCAELNARVFLATYRTVGETTEDVIKSGIPVMNGERKVATAHHEARTPALIPIAFSGLWYDDISVLGGDLLADKA